MTTDSEQIKIEFTGTQFKIYKVTLKDRSRKIMVEDTNGKIDGIAFGDDTALSAEDLLIIEKVITDNNYRGYNT